MQFQIEMVRTLKGCPLSVLMVLYMAQQPVRAEWVCMMTGYSDKPVSQALGLLQEYGYVGKTTQGFFLEDGARQLPLAPTADLPESTPETLAIKTSQRNVSTKEEEEKSRKLSDFSGVEVVDNCGYPVDNFDNGCGYPVDSAVDNVEGVEKSRRNSDFSGGPGGKSRKISDFSCNDNDVNDFESSLRSKEVVRSESSSSQKRRRRPENQKPLVELCHKLGIFSPTADRIAKIPGITPAYIRGHVEAGRREGVGMGLVIHRIETGQYVPGGGSPHPALSQGERGRDA